jgi:hypothetical protein
MCQPFLTISKNWTQIFKIFTEKVGFLIKAIESLMHPSKDVVKGKCKILRMQTKIKSNSLDIGKSLYYNIKNKITGELVFAG